MIYALYSKLSCTETNGAQTSEVFGHMTLGFYVDDTKNDALPSKEIVLDLVKRLCDDAPGKVDEFYAKQPAAKTEG